MTSKDGPETYKVVTANRLVDGGIVYLRRADGTHEWMEVIEEASIFPESEIDQVLETTEADVARNIIVAPYSVEITANTNRSQPEKPFGRTAPSIKYGRAALDPDFNI